MRRIWIRNIRRYAIVDDEDYDRVSGHHWFSRGDYCACHLTAKGQKRRSVSLHQMVMRCPGRCVYFKDGNRLNCRKENLSLYRSDVTGKMTSELKAIILGMHLGDSTSQIRINHGRKRFGIGIAHGAKQRDYVFHKADILSDYVSTPPKMSMVSGWGVKKLEAWIFNTRLSSDFDFLEMCYNKKLKKYVSKKWVDSLTISSLAYWWMDDGTLSSNRYAVFCTNSFSITECHRLMKRLREMGFDSKIQFYRRTYKGVKKCEPMIKMDYHSTYEFIQQIAHLVVDCLKYKTNVIDAFRAVECSVCGDMALAPRNGGRALCSKKTCRAIRGKEAQERYRERNRDLINKNMREWRRNQKEKAS